MIQSFEVINLPHSHSQLKIGDTIDTNGGKNILLIGDNGVGKTTFLGALFESLRRNNDFYEGKNLEERNPYHTFATEFDGQYRRMTGGGVEDDERGEITDTERLAAIMKAFSDYFGKNITNIFHSNIPPSNEVQVKMAIHRYIHIAKDINQGELPEHDYPNTFEVADDDFIDALKIYAKGERLPLEKVYGGAVLMISGALAHIETEATTWGYIVPKVKKIAELRGIKVLSLLEEKGGESKEKGKSSLGERTLDVVGKISAHHGVIILDEPTNGVSLTNVARVREQVIGAMGSQIIASTHNEKLLEMATEHPNWKVVALPLK